jgi:hypothetical protein
MRLLFDHKRDAEVIALLLHCYGFAKEPVLRDLLT